MIRRFLGVALGFSFLFSCHSMRKVDVLLGKKEVNLSSNTEKGVVSFNYIGCGGFLIQKATTALLIDPYFSNAGPLFTLPFKKKLKSDSIGINNFFSRFYSNAFDDQGQIKAVLISHPHYDHLFDVPFIYNRNLQTKTTKIIGGITTQKLLALANIENTTTADKFILINNNENCLPKENSEWIYIAEKQIRILPILTEHAPHFSGLKFLKTGCEIDAELETFPTNVKKMPEGKTYSFLIDFLNPDGTIDFRIFSHAGGASSAPIGFPPKNEIKNKEIDVAILCVANYNQVDNYPDSLLQHIKPKHLILAHWENFFKSRNQLMKQPKAVPGTNVKKFMKKIEILSTDNFDFTLPNPNAQINFKY